MKWWYQSIKEVTDVQKPLSMSKYKAFIKAINWTTQMLSFCMSEKEKKKKKTYSGSCISNAFIKLSLFL